MKKQKFKKGNLVEVLQGHVIWSKDSCDNIKWEDIRPDQVGEKAIVQYSYNDMYGGGDTDIYSIMFLETGNTSAWKHETELKFLDEGGEHLFKQAKDNKNRIMNSHTDFKYIFDNLDKGVFSSTTILYLFDMIGYKSPFLSNGEFYVLHSDWALLHPVFVHVKNSKTLEEAESILTNEGLNQIDLSSLFYNLKKQHNEKN